MLFDELVNNKRMEDPEERKAEDLKRVSKKPVMKKTSTSVSIEKYRRTSAIINTITVLLVITGVIYLIYRLIEMFIKG